jgi:uncharacterized 2Fe-2S/4Fe-4S cluster protein (DUF4445 family)
MKLIHPKTGIVRETEGFTENKINALKRAGFVDLSTYRAPKKPKVKVEPSLAEEVEREGEKIQVSDEDVINVEKAIHEPVEVKTPAKRKPRSRAAPKKKG